MIDAGGQDRSPHRYVFVAGLHRTGTSLLAQVMGTHPDISTIRGADVPENEGCYLQGAIPHTARHGVPGHFATDASQHLTETSAFNSLAVKDRLEREWGVWFDSAKAWRLEKSPVNLTRMRLLQALFPRAHFVIITRHPLVMAHALGKWSDRSVADLASYGVAAYRKMLDDVAYLHAALILRYEDFVDAPASHCRAIESFLGVDAAMTLPPVRDGNTDYFVQENEGAIRELGYGPRGEVAPLDPIIRHPLRERREGALKQMSGARIAA